MDASAHAIVFTIQSAVMELLESIDLIAKDVDQQEQEELKSEVQRKILMLIAAIIVSNRTYETGRWRFLSVLVNWQDLPGGETRYLNEYATRWKESLNEVPKFYADAIKYDVINKTNIARAMLCEIQIIGNSVATADGKVNNAEKQIIRDYVAFLDEKLVAALKPAVMESPIVQEVKPEAVPPPVYIPQPALGRFATTVVTPNADLRWIPAGQSIDIGGFHIPSGMIYVSNGQAMVSEASAVNLRLPVGRSLESSGPLNYYPNYTFINPDQRATYLEWLANGRVDKNPETRQIGYVFIFFYGLERRLLIDKSQDQEVVAELVRLLQQYGPHTHSRSLQSYVGQLVHFWGWQQGLIYYSQLLEWMKTLPVSLIGQDDLAIILASYSRMERPLSDDLLYEVMSRNIESRRSVVISRVNSEFRSLFAKRCLEQFPQGLVLKGSHRTNTIHYRAASPTLLHNHSGFSIEVPEIASLQVQLRPLIKIWDACIDGLAGYSRTKFKNGKILGSFDVYQALPDELRATAAHPLSKQWDGILAGARNGKGYSVIEVSQIAVLIGLSQREKLTSGQSYSVAEAVESLGFEIEPDARREGVYTWNQEIAVYKAQFPKAVVCSDNYKAASVLLKLCLLVAGADGHVASEELEVSRHFIKKNLTLNGEDTQRLDALEQTLVADPLRIKDSLGRIASAVPKDKRALICEVLVHVAAADNVVTKDEIRVLEKIFKAFGLTVDDLNANLKSVCSDFKEVTIQARGRQVPGESIPASVQSFRINMDRVDQIARETSEVIGILSKVMVDEDPAGEPSALISNEKNDPETVELKQDVVIAPEWMKSLDAKYQRVLLRLVARDSWSKIDFDIMVKESHLMPLNAFDAINEWSDEHLGDFILEGDDPIVVHKDSIT